LNLYSYCRNNPITYLDPDGKRESPYFTGRWRQYLYKKWANEGGSEYADQMQAELHKSDFIGGIIAGIIILAIITKSMPVDDYSEDDIDRMKDGKPPLDDKGNPMELHHEDQEPGGELKEMTKEKHRGKGYDKINHPYKGKRPSKIDRDKFKKERENYWKKKAEQRKKD